MPSVSLKLATVVPGLCLTVAACSPITGNSLLTDQKKDSSSLTLDKTPKSEELYLKSFSVTLNATGQSKAEVGGECYVSTYPLHQIVALNNAGTPIQIIDINPATPANNTASCKNGRFNFSINAEALAAGQHSIRIVLRAFEMNTGAPIINETQGATYITLNK